MRAWLAEVPVQVGADGKPVAVEFRGRFLQVTPIQSWRWAGDTTPGPEERFYWLVETDTGTILELYEDRTAARAEGTPWIVTRVQD